MSSKEGGMARLFEEVTYQLKNPNIAHGWNAGQLLEERATTTDGSAIVFLGGHHGGNCALATSHGVRLEPSMAPLQSSCLTAALRLLSIRQPCSDWSGEKRSVDDWLGLS